MPLSVGSHVGPYEVVGPLGAGGMGEVWRARDTRLKRDVALKILGVSFAADPDRLARFEREAQGQREGGRQTRGYLTRAAARPADLKRRFAFTCRRTVLWNRGRHGWTHFLPRARCTGRAALR